MKPESMVRLSRLTRPFMRYRTPVIYRLLKMTLNALCPPGKKGTAQHLVAGFDGGLINVDTSSSIEYHILFRGCHEPEIVNLIQRAVRSGDVCLDVGANVGAHTLVMARAAGPKGRVVAVEPHPRIGARLLQNLALNHLDNVTVVRAAISDKDGTADFFGFGAEAFEQGISSFLPDKEATEKMTVRTISGATLQREAQLDRCDFLKIDVEGFESVVLKELSDLIAAHRPFIICEYRKQHWEKFGHLLREVLDRFHALGYQLYYIRRNVTRPVLESALPDSCELVCVPGVKEKEMILG
jgi:FkbM family methyltransferase